MSVLSRLRPVFLGVFLSMSVLTLAACNTIAGFGQDTQAAGEAIEDTAEDVAN